MHGNPWLSQEKNVEQAQEAVRIAELNYSEGLATNLDVSTAQVALSQAKTNYSQALLRLRDLPGPARKGRGRRARKNKPNNGGMP